MAPAKFQVAGITPLGPCEEAQGKGWLGMQPCFSFGAYLLFALSGWLGVAHCIQAWLVQLFLDIALRPFRSLIIVW